MKIIIETKDRIYSSVEKNVFGQKKKKTIRIVFISFSVEKGQVLYDEMIDRQNEKIDDANDEQNTVRERSEDGLKHLTKPHD